MNSVLEARDVSKSFAGIKAVSGANLTLTAGSVHALLGENGAGKSTLVKILTGVHSADSGTVVVKGEETHFTNPTDATRAGIAVVHQERNIVPLFSVGENISLQDPPRRWGFVDRAERDAIARRMLDSLQLGLDPAVAMTSLSVAQVQLVEMAKALVLDAQVLILDEPTASLTDTEAEHLFDVVRQLSQSGVAVVFVSHKLEEVFALCDTVTILRDGVSVVESQPLADYTQRQIVNLMVGRELAEREVRFRSVDRSDTPRLRLNEVSTALGHKDISFSVHPGEIFGLYGLVGAGRTELARSVLGLSSITAGTIEVNGRAVTVKNVADALRTHSMGYVSEDRKQEGLFLEHSNRFNVASTIWDKISNITGVSGAEERRITSDAITRLGIKTVSTEQITGQLSGGNQQKVSLSRWLAADVDLLFIDEPTVGVDVRTKEEFQQLILDLADSGMAVVLIDSDLPEMIALADRIGVMNDYKLLQVVENTKAYAPISSKIMELIHDATVDAEEPHYAHDPKGSDDADDSRAHPIKPSTEHHHTEMAETHER